MRALPRLQSLVRIPDTLMMAMEFVNLYTPSDHQPKMEELRKMVRRVLEGNNFEDGCPWLD